MELQGQKDWTRQFENGPGQEWEYKSWRIREMREAGRQINFPPQKRHYSFCVGMPSSPSAPNSHFPIEAHSHSFSQHQAPAPVSESLLHVQWETTGRAQV